MSPIEETTWKKKESDDGMSRTTSTDIERKLGMMYFRWTLDCIVELAYAVSNDFVARPRFYQDDDIPKGILNLRMSYGTNPSLPNTQQRELIFSPILGNSECGMPDNGMNGSQSAFYKARKKLIEAAVVYSERIYESGLAMLEERVRSALVPIRSHLNSVYGFSLQVSNAQSEDIFNLSSEILSSPTVASVFGVEPAGGKWPLDSDNVEDANGAKLVEAIGKNLSVATEYVFSYEKFILLQRVAREGRLAIEWIVSPDPVTDEKALRELVKRVYTWSASMSEFQA